MAQTTTTHAYDFQGRTLIDRNGDKIGKVEELYCDDDSGQPEWALVHTGLFGTKKTFVPISGASPTGEELRVDVDKDRVKDAPRIDTDEHLSEAEERQLYEHYGVSYTDNDTTTGHEGTTTGQGQRFSRESKSGSDDDAMTRSEE